MKFVSYAQNFEDVVLYRALGHVWNGTYVDVGAFDPTKDSVTKAFYDRGWSGINIDPVQAFHRRFVEDRPRDRNIFAAISDASGSLPYYVVGKTGLSTLDAGIAEDHRQAGHEVWETSVPVLTLGEVLHDLSDRPIHFLKIDVEGHEAKVLAGLDLQAIRPWILVIEATVPGQATATHSAWEDRVVAARYHFAYFDGLSRYYVAEEHAGLAEKLAIPPNVFDEFETLHTVELREALTAAERSYQSLSELLTSEREAARSHAEELQHRLAEEAEWASQALASVREDRDRALAEAQQHFEHSLAATKEAAAHTELEARGEREHLRQAHQAALAQLDEIYRSKAWHLIVAYRRGLNFVRRKMGRGTVGLASTPSAAVPNPPSAPPELILHKDAGFTRKELARRIALKALSRRS